MNTARKANSQLAYVDTLDDALAGAEAVIVVADWKQPKDLDPAETLAKLARPVIFDSRNVLGPTA